MPVTIKKSTSLNKLNLTPMIDVVFQLLIFFLVAAKYEAAENQMGLVLPKADEAMARISKPKEITINVDREGKIFVGGRNLNDPALLELLKQAQADNPGRQAVVIRGDANAPLQHVVSVMNVCAKADIHDARITSAATPVP